jgi:hypothetical protein
MLDGKRIYIIYIRYLARIDIQKQLYFPQAVNLMLTGTYRFEAELR